MILRIITQCILVNIAFSYSDKPILIVVSYDGFKYNYLSKEMTPALYRLRQEGTYSEYIYNVFPTKTFPNHFSIATGMFAEEHGIIGNSFYDPSLKRMIKQEEAMYKQNADVIPIWTLNELSGYDRWSGSMMWPGGKYEYHNRTIAYVKAWDREVDLYARIDKAIKWLTDPLKPANLVMIYLEEPDFHSHIYGSRGKATMDMIIKLDNVTQYLHTQLIKCNLAQRAHVVHLGDHGMVDVKFKNIIDIQKYLIPNTYKISDNSPVLHIIPNEGFENDIYNRLKRASIEVGHFTVYRKKELPKKWHIKNNIRVPPIMLVADKGYAFQDLIQAIKKYENYNDIKVGPETEVGLHGYDNNIKDMYSFFMIRGPTVRKNHKIEPFSIVDLYSLFAEILEIKSPRPKNDNLIHRIINETSNNIWVTILITVGGVVLSLILISCAAAVTIILIKRQQNMTTTAALNKRFPQTFQQTIEAQHLLESEEA